MRLSFDTPAKRLGLAIAAAVAAALVAALAFDAFEPKEPELWSVASDEARSRPAVHDANPSAGVLERVLVQPPEVPEEAAGVDDEPTEPIVVEAPPADEETEPPSADEAAEPPRRAAVATAPRERPAAPPVESGRREPAPVAAPRDDVARTDDTTSDDARRLNREGIELINAGRPDQAIAPLERAVSLQPRDAELLGNLGYAYMLVGDNETAARRLRRALDFAPNRSATWLNLGQTYAELGQRELAVDAVVTGYRNSTRKATVRAALLAAATGSRYSPRWREAAGLALVKIGDR